MDRRLVPRLGVFVLGVLFGAESLPLSPFPYSSFSSSSLFWYLLHIVAVFFHVASSRITYHSTKSAKRKTAHKAAESAVGIETESPAVVSIDSSIKTLAPADEIVSEIMAPQVTAQNENVSDSALNENAAAQSGSLFFTRVIRFV